MAFSRYETNLANEDYDCYIYVNGSWVQMEPYIYDNDSAQGAAADVAAADTSIT